MSTHAKLSPSGAHRWMACPGSVALEATVPGDGGSEYAAEGTAAHALAEFYFHNPEKAAQVRFARFVNGQLTDLLVEKRDVDAKAINAAYVEIDADMHSYVRKYVDTVRDYAAGAQLFVEERVPIGHITGEEDAGGTADAVVIALDGSELQVHDLKYGRGVEVIADNNPQLMLYALGCLEKFDMLLADKPTIRLVIHQPRLGAVSEWVCEWDALIRFGADAEVAAGDTRAEEPSCNPGEKQCQFCKAKAICPALAAVALEDFDVIEDVVDGKEANTSGIDNEALAGYMAKAPLIELWLTAIRARVESELLAGNAVPGYKLVAGRKGNRAWTDAEAAAAEIKKMRVKNEDMYDFKLKSPAQMSKFFEDNPRHLTRIAKFITQADSKPSVAPVSDKRPALGPMATADDFEDLTKE